MLSSACTDPSVSIGATGKNTAYLGIADSTARVYKMSLRNSVHDSSIGRPAALIVLTSRLIAV